MENLAEFKNKIIDDVVDDIKKLHPVIRICYPKQILTNDHNPLRLNVNCDVHGRILSFNYG